MDTRNDLVDADLHILTFDIPDDALERAAGADPAITLVHCTNPLVWECPAIAANIAKLPELVRNARNACSRLALHYCIALRYPM